MAVETPAQEEAADEARFEATLRNLVNTPHKPHKSKEEGREPKPAPKAG